MTARAPRIALVAATLAAVLAVAPATANEGAAAPENQRDLPVGSQYFRLDPFTVPVMGPDSITRHLTFIVTLELTDDALRDKIRQKIRAGASPRHVPAKIVSVADIPRTKSGKITELAVRDVIHGRVVKNTEALANPEALDLYRDLPDLRA